MTLPLALLMETRGTLLNIRRNVAAVSADMAQHSGEESAAADALQDREDRIVSDAIRRLWEGTPYDVRLENGWDPWRVVLIADGETAGAGESWSHASEALTSAIDGALDTIKAHVREEG